MWTIGSWMGCPAKGGATMTLIVAGVADQSIWMVGDTAITGGTIELRERENLPKIEVGRTFPALIAFAKGPEHGAEVARKASVAGTLREALDILKEGTSGDGVE